MPKTTFVAYSSKIEEVSAAVFDAVRKANARTLPIRFEPWQFNDVAGLPLVSPILEKIDDSPFLVADITTLNLNVIYEIGFAIGRGKRVFIIRHAGIAGDKELANSAGIFDTLGYHEYSSVEDLAHRISAEIEESPLPIAHPPDRKALVYVLEPPSRSQAVSILVSRMKKAGFYHYRSFQPGEDTRLSATDAIRQVAVSSGVFVPLQESHTPGANIHNIRAMFVLGLADGMSTPRLAIAPSGFPIPLDIRDTVKPYQRAEDIIEAVAEFSPSVVSHASRLDPSELEGTSVLQALNIGDSRAENEMTTLGRYYMRTDQSERALRGEVNLVVGRKGSGKTATLIRVRDKMRGDRRNIVVDLLPDGYQLIKLKEDILEYLTEGARQHLITAFWEYLILLEVTYKLLEKDADTHRRDHNLFQLYVDLKQAYEVEDFSSEGDFSERLLNLSQRLTNGYRSRFGKQDTQKLTAAAVTELLYTHDLKKLRQKVSDYLNFKESVWILFDNLDKGWSTQGVDVIDAIVLRCLVDAGRKLEREFQKAGHDLHCIVFVRNDVYDHLMRNSPDYGKELRAQVDWSDPDLLREMFRLRLASGLGADNANLEFEKIWREICVSHYQGEESSAFLIDRTLMRPRNFIKLFNHCRGFATTLNHSRIEEDDIEKGVAAYSNDLREELNRELTDVMPYAKDLLYHFMDAQAVITRAELDGVLASAGIGTADYEDVIKFLLYYGVLGITASGQEHFIYNVNYDMKVLEVRIARSGANTRYIVNPAFWPGLGISPPPPDILLSTAVS
ncbi:P-loop ATPase, Sll1717 family [Phyllobacterium phragmitis]